MLTVFITCASGKEAGRIATALVKGRLAACVNYFPCRSVFRWKGRMKKSKEFVLLAKTTEKKYSALERLVLRLHSHNLPAVFAWQDNRASKAYLKWVEASCARH